MAIEDEIINISDLDAGTEILNTDKLLIETNNGTKLLSFKDFVISTDNITFEDRLNDTSVASEIDGSNILTQSVDEYTIPKAGTTEGKTLTYGDLKHVIDMAKKNYDDITALSARVDDIGDLGTQVTANADAIAANQVHLDGTSIGSATTILKSVNFNVKNLDRVPKASGNQSYIGFDHSVLPSGADWSTINSDLTNFQLNGTRGFEITYPNTAAYVASTILFQGHFRFRNKASGVANSVTIRMNILDADNNEKTTRDFSSVSDSKNQVIDFDYMDLISPGDTIFFKVRSATSGNKVAIYKNSYLRGTKITS